MIADTLFQLKVDGIPRYGIARSYRFRRRMVNGHPRQSRSAQEE
jgi:hypothetical protein